MNRAEPIGLGVIGLGGFGMFALQQFLQVNGVRLKLIGGTTRQEAHRAAARYGATVGSVEDVLAAEEVELVYINTPPFLHAEQAAAALQAGKHVIVEKPLATELAAGERLLQLAADREAMLTTNLMQRYNPLAIQLKRLIEMKLLGEPLYMSLENHAVDEGLSRDHWFWDAAKSGGIFVEHGVHFFDLAADWFGRGEVVGAGRHARRDGCEDQVWCDLVYSRGTVTRFYHGFNQSSRLEQQTWQLVFERGRVEMQGWIPLALTVTAVADENQSRQLCELFPEAVLDVLDNYPADRRVFQGHGVRQEAYQKLRLHDEGEPEKQVLYCQLLRSLFSDQIAWLRDRSHHRIVTETDGLESLRTALAARELSRHGGAGSNSPLPGVTE